MLLLGINPEDSFKLSFLALIPASVGAAGVTVLLSNLQLGAVVSIVGIPVILIAILVSGAIGIVFIRLLLRFAGSRRIALLTISLGILAVFSGVTSFLTGAG
jgi:undecaprenyl-diphosphatase